ncbi:MAG: phosphatase PAP2 family protein [Pseudomonadota bacterium]
MGSENMVTRSLQIEHWVRWGIRTYLIGIILCLHLYTVASLACDLPGSKLFHVLFLSVAFPTSFILICLWLFKARVKKGWEEFESLQDKDGNVSWGENRFTNYVFRFRWILATVFMFGFWSGGYFLLSYADRWGVAVTLNWEVDTRIPRLSEYSFIYLTVYWFFLLPFLYCNDGKFFWPMVRSYLVVMGVSFLVFAVFPVKFPREQLAINSLSDWALERIYVNDTPNNCLPSTHCALSLLAALVLLEIEVRKGIVGIYMAVAIAVSTLFTKQHYVADVLTGHILALVVFVYFFKPKWLVKRWMFERWLS